MRVSSSLDADREFVCALVSIGIGAILGRLCETPNSHSPSEVANLLKILVQAASVRSLHDEENENLRAKNNSILVV